MIKELTPSNVKSENDVKTFLGALDSSTGSSFNQQYGRPAKRPTGAKATSSLRGYRKYGTSPRKG